MTSFLVLSKAESLFFLDAGKMTGYTSLPIAEDGYGDQQQQLRGGARILGPRWAHLPNITIGLLGVQIFWSVEMSYGALLL